MKITFAFAVMVVALATAANNAMMAIHCSVVSNGIGMMRTSNCPIEISAVERKADVHISVLNSRLDGAKLAIIEHVRPVSSRLPDRGAAERDVDMFSSQKMDACAAFSPLVLLNSGRSRGAVIARASSRACSI
jgi:hypothetical protein